MEKLTEEDEGRSRGWGKLLSLIIKTLKKFWCCFRPEIPSSGGRRCLNRKNRGMECDSHFLRFEL